MTAPLTEAELADIRRRGWPMNQQEWIGYAGRLIATIDERDASFDLRWKADMRAIKRWQEAHPGNEPTWPDHADMVVCLLATLDHERLEHAALVEAAEKVSATLHEHNVDFSGLASEYPAVYYIGRSIQALRAALPKPEGADDAG